MAESNPNESTASVVSRGGTVAIIGRPNVGKSTLLNLILGQKLAITSHKAQTTRHAILGIKTRAGGQILFVDTPGIHERGGSALNRYLNRAARAAVADTDLALLVVEAGRWTEEDAKALEAIAAAGVPVIAVVNKVDRIAEKSSLLPYLQALGERHAFRHVVLVSATKGDQVETLERLIVESLPEGEPVFPEDQLTDRSERFFAAELVREQLLQLYGKELPYCTTVEIERFSEEGATTTIDAVIWVEKPGQKAIVIGAEGKMLKAVGSEARADIERMLEKRVHLGLWVKVREGWSDDDRALRQLGYDG